MDIMLDRGQLLDAQSGLKTSIGEFENAADTNDNLEEAIGRPDGRGSLLNQVIDFESAWKSKRGTLKENLQSILDQLTSILDGWEEWDTTTAADLEGSTTTENLTAPGGVR